MLCDSATGRDQDIVFFQTNDRASPRPVLHAEVNVRSALLVDCEKFGNGWCVNFDALSLEAGPQTKSIELRRGDGGPLDPKVLGIEPVSMGQRQSRPDAEALLRTIEPGERYALELTIRPPFEPGLVRLATGVAEQPEDEVHFTSYGPRPKKE